MERESKELEPGAEWREDPTGRHQYRLWQDGWTENVSNFGVRSTDPYTVTGPSTAPTLDSILSPTPAPSSRPSRRAPTSSPIKTIGGLAVLVGALLAAIAPLVPAFDHSAAVNLSYIDLPNNYGSHGIWIALTSVVLALFALLGILKRQSSPAPAVVTLIVSALLLGQAYSDWHDWDEVWSLGGGSGLGLGAGLSLCLIGTVLMVLGSITALVGQRR